VPPRLQPLATTPTRPAARPAVALTVVVVNFGRRDETAALAEQLDRSEALRTGAAEVVVVDNDADPVPLQEWGAARPGVRVLSFARNRGFARAVNEGCQYSRGPWLLLLNPDVSVPDEFLDHVTAAVERRAEADPNAGVVGFELRHADGSRQPSAGPFPTFANVVAGLVRSRKSRRCRGGGRHAASVPWVTGCCLAVRRACWKELGGFDEDFFLYYEDVDLCRRAREAGWTVWYEPGLPVTHFHPLHSRRVPPALRLVTRHALLTYAAKHWPAWQLRALGRLVGMEAACRRRLAEWRGDAEAAEHFERLKCLAADMTAGRSVRARALLARSARDLAAAADA
jgi:N-acetylglucosaminyl-diphospho-decaprenol L-rhamnosyltransferase